MSAAGGAQRALRASYARGGKKRRLSGPEIDCGLLISASVLDFFLALIGALPS
jgi:hypothetical protein